MADNLHRGQKTGRRRPGAGVSDLAGRLAYARRPLLGTDGQDAGRAPGALRGWSSRPGNGISGRRVGPRICPGFRLFYIAIGAGNRVPGVRMRMAAYSEYSGGFGSPRPACRVEAKNPKNSGIRGPLGSGRDLGYSTSQLRRGVVRSSAVYLGPRFPDISGGFRAPLFRGESRLSAPRESGGPRSRRRALSYGYF